MIEAYRQKLASLEDWDEYLRAESRLPGPRANLELAHIVAEVGDERCFEHLLSFDPQVAPTNTPGEFLAVCGVLGLGRLLSGGRLEILERLRQYASDPRWRIREAVAMALQSYGRVDIKALITAMDAWSQGGLLEKRAAAAALCEPDLLRNHSVAEGVLHILDSITASLSQVEDRKYEDFKTLRNGLGYCWSVAVVACPDPGKDFIERWIDSPDKDIRWVMKQNLKKKRLERMDAGWVARQLARIDDSATAA